MKFFTNDELKEILRLHGMWLRAEEGGERAYLQGAYLQGADLQGAYLQGADLHRAYLQGADLQGADLQGADLHRADLQGADLRGADLRGAYLQGAYLRGAYLRGADLHRADLQGADLREASGQNTWIKTLGSDIWSIAYTFDRLQIGCENHLITEWWGFDDDRISKMDHQALEFWKRWKPILQAIIANNPAQATRKQ